MGDQDEFDRLDLLRPNRNFHNSPGDLYPSGEIWVYKKVGSGKRYQNTGVPDPPGVDSRIIPGKDFQLGGSGLNRVAYLIRDISSRDLRQIDLPAAPDGQESNY